MHVQCECRTGTTTSQPGAAVRVCAAGGYGSPARRRNSTPAPASHESPVAKSAAQHSEPAVAAGPTPHPLARAHEGRREAPKPCCKGGKEGGKQKEELVRVARRFQGYTAWHGESGP